MDFLKWLMGLNNIQNPHIPTPPGRHTVSGNPSIDDASTLMPYEHRRVLDRIIKQGRFGMEPFGKLGMGSDTPGQLQVDPDGFKTGEYSQQEGMKITPLLMRFDPDYIAQTLTHESQHAMQPQDILNLWRQRPEFPVTGYKPVGNPYLDNPREVEARSASTRVRKAVLGKR